ASSPCGFASEWREGIDEDLGDIATARATEGYLPLWLSLWWQGSEAPPQTAETRSASGSASLPPVLACPPSRGLDIYEGEPNGRTKLASFVTICAFGDA